ncbi:hypothetical protein [Carboxylicivirga sp. N1Y90]|uniref:hypothetical protein n=1 Tax=Carboxylicivirga fragile TaxID=3417571 RepID=UPI003D33B753|nr:hypothetical protein [Marinilabiliaceae bacterium N1Y90]
MDQFTCLEQGVNKSAIARREFEIVDAYNTSPFPYILEYSIVMLLINVLIVSVMAAVKARKTRKHNKDEEDASDEGHDK